MTAPTPPTADVLARVKLTRAHARRALAVLERLTVQPDGFSPRLSLALRSASDMQRAVLLELGWALELLGHDQEVGTEAAKEVLRSRR